ncbi:MAG: hypothetical protein ACRD21_15020 [Vicinamibacteria bacterium]
MPTAEKRPTTYEVILGLEQPADATISPGGSGVAFVVNGWDEKKDAHLIFPEASRVRSPRTGSLELDVARCRSVV